MYLLYSNRLRAIDSFLLEQHNINTMPVSIQLKYGG